MQLIQVYFGRAFIIDLQCVNPFDHGFREVLESNEKLKSEVDNMIEINKKYEFNEDEVKEAIQLEKEKRELLT